jgi:ClpP class serine protease
MHRPVARTFAALALLLSATVARAEFAEVTLKDGRNYTGEIIEETKFKIVLRVRVGAMESPMTFTLADVKTIERLKKPAGDKPGVTKPGTDTNENAIDAPKTKETGGYAVVPLRQEFGTYITAQFVEEVLRKAAQEKAEAVVFEVDSPGGLVRELEAVRDALDAAEAKDNPVKIAFYVQKEAMSAAALLCLSSHNFYVGKGASFGAAVGWHTNDTGKVEVDAKFNAAFASSWRGRAERVGRPGILVDAMVLLEKEIWADQSTTPWKLSATGGATGGRPEDRNDDDASSDMPSRRRSNKPEAKPLVQLDSKETILALTAEEALKVGAVDGLLGSGAAVADKLGLEKSGRVAFDGEKMWTFRVQEVDRDMKVVRDALEKYHAATAMIKASKTTTEAAQKIGMMVGSLKKVQALYSLKSHVRNEMARDGVTAEEIDGVITRLQEIQRQVRKM